MAPVGQAPEVSGPDGTVAVPAPLQGTIVSLAVSEGDEVHVGQPLLIMESMKMEHVISAETSGIIRQLTVGQGDAVFEGHPLAFIEETEVEVTAVEQATDLDLDYIRPDLAEIVERHELGMDAARPEAVARRRKTGQRTARENIYDMCDPDSYVEYGPMVIAAQRQRRALDDLVRRTPADGMIAGVGRVNGDLFDEKAAQCIVISYDYTVLAGTQGFKNHYKKDRMFELAERWQASGCLLCRRWRRSSGRHRLVESLRVGCAGLLPVGQAQRHGAPGRHYLRPVFCRQCGDSGLLRCDYCDRRIEYRHGWPGHD